MTVLGQEFGREVYGIAFPDQISAGRRADPSDFPGRTGGHVAQCNLVKRYADDMVLNVTDSGVQVLGGHGYVRDHPSELWLRNGRGFAVLTGIATV